MCLHFLRMQLALPRHFLTFLLLADLNCFCRSSAVAPDEQMELYPAALDGQKVSRRSAEGRPNSSIFCALDTRPAAALPNLPVACGPLYLGSAAFED